MKPGSTLHDENGRTAEVTAVGRYSVDAVELQPNAGDSWKVSLGGVTARDGRYVADAKHWISRSPIVR